MLLPPLLKLARLEDLYRQELYCPPQIRKQLLQITSCPSSLKIEEYALVALYLLDTDGPMGWLHKDWVKWNRERPELLEHLTQHSRELDYLLTPAAFPVRSDDPNLNKQFEIAYKWRELAQCHPLALQTNLLHASKTVRYPHAYLFKRLLESELASPSKPWHTIWDNLLQKEMEYGRSATYQTCLYLRLLIHKDNHEQYKAVINELISAIEKPCLQQTQALNTLINLHMRDLRDARFLWHLRDLLDLRELRYLRSLRHLHYLRFIRDLRDLRDMMDLQQLRALVDLLDTAYLRDSKALQYLRNMRGLLNSNEIVHILCSTLEHPDNASISSVILLTLSSMLNYDGILPQTKQQIQDSLKLFNAQEQKLQEPSIEHRQLIRVITRQIEPIAPRQNGPMLSSPEARVVGLQRLKQPEDLRKQDIQEILAACNDPRPLPNEPGTVGQFAWRLLSRSWNMDKEAQEAVVQALDDDNAIICAAAALLLRHAGILLNETRTAAGEKIMEILKDEERSHCPLDPPNYSRIWRLNDVLFETLQAIAEKSLVEYN